MREKGGVSVKRWAAIAAAAIAGAAFAQDDASGTPAHLQGNPGAMFGPDAYPPAAMRAGEQGRVVARLAIGADGRVSACTVDQSSGSAALDEATCRIASGRMTFAPARDDRGQAVASSYTLPIRWVLPQASGEPIVPLAMTLVATIHANRSVSRCTGSVNGRAVPVPMSSCTSYVDLFAHAFDAQATGAQANTIVATVERRQLYSGQLIPPGRAAAGAVLLAEHSIRFRIGADGRASGCRSATKDGEMLMTTADPCDQRLRFEVEGRDPKSFPVEATWTTMASYSRAARP